MTVSSPRILRSRARRSLVAVAAALALVGLSACSSGGAATSGSSSGGLDTVTAGKFTVATGQPAYSPWVVDNKPENGKGFESAVAYAVAKQLGYTKSDVVWTRTTFDAAIAPGPKDFDVNLQQFSVTTDRKKAVDFSSPYYKTSQALVTTAKSKAAGLTTAAELKKVTIGVAAGTTSLSVVEKELGTTPKIFNSNDDAVLALKSGQVDAIAVDLPTAFYLADSELTGGKVVGQFADTSGGDEFAFVLSKGSTLTKKVSAAVDALQKSGELETITHKWLSAAVAVPVIQ
ncbi:amino acid ABC transporter substrate-binding protein [Frondihabitans sucicola]|uniref:Amino acid ABC transporter substrate-binding protein n=1 Tax=Frondihabitans sucicola TaxID=1268041 RepID=A0ABM8GUR3_9MICO|nr:ABC transporter substrate-binding protein [Frondihabitans sucicola]BDZ52074.1 amino acid ABC transporter substrate-binding protein [Frondihabitans sucicola]